MARTNDASIYPERWSNRKLLSEIRRIANMERFSVGFYEGDDVTFKHGWAEQTKSPEIGDFVREQTRLYRDTYLDPLLTELERRTLKGK